MISGKFLSALTVAITAFCAIHARAEEGMWTFDNPPLKQLKDKYNFVPDKAWLDHVRLSSVRLNDGGSGSFVSPNGLLLTNHHVARGQLQKNSTAEHNYVENGFYAATQAQEMKSPDLEVNVLVSMENVTARVQDALKNSKTPEQEFAARRAEIAKLERESQDKTGLRSDVVTLYQGGEYWLHRYKKYTDVRLVFAPEQQVAFFGGDPDNFTYPRYDLDMALFRVYENGRPVETKDYLKWNARGAADGDLVLVSGHPGSTQRNNTMAQLEYDRDTSLPAILGIYRARLDVLRAYAAKGPDQAREAGSRIFNFENAVKAIDGEYKGLKDASIMATKRQQEEGFRTKVMANPQWKSEWGGAWSEIAQAEKKAASRITEMDFHGLDSDLANLAMSIVQYVAEVKKPDGDRLPEYHDAQLESLRFRLYSPAPIYPGMEIARITGALQLDIEHAGANDPFVKAVLNGRTPAEAATDLVNGSKLGDPAVRKQLIEGGESAVNASTDPMIVLARKLDPMRRELIQWMQHNVQSVEERAGEQIGKARFAVYGKSTYPDATFTLRLSYGQVKGYPMNGTKAPSKTTFFGLYDRANSFDLKAPFNLPARYADGKAKLDLSKLDLTTPLDFVTTNDITGGNSGSPVVDRQGDIVGLIFDGNIESLVGDFVYDGDTNRAVAVHTAGMTEALRKLYGADALLNELTTGQLRK
ncbi:MAG: S46 family peptidase [Acidobacteriota bacterium]|nr:S46 family peptidase [Acidobacteriota bacterium]